jgi:hypothetical protein
MLSKDTKVTTWLINSCNVFCASVVTASGATVAKVDIQPLLEGLTDKGYGCRIGHQAPGKRG